MTTGEHGPWCCPGHKPPRGEEADICPAGQPVWCMGCASQIRSALAELEDLAADLGTADGQLLSSGARSERSGASFGSPSPAPGLDLVEALVSWVLLVEDELLEHVGAGRRVFPNLRPLSGPLHTLIKYSSALLAWDTRYLADERDDRRLAEAAVVGRQILRWHRDLTAATGMDRLVHRLPAPCPRCNAMGLYREDGAEEVRCAVCRATWAQERYEHMVLVLAQRWKAGR